VCVCVCCTLKMNPSFFIEKLRINTPKPPTNLLICTHTHILAFVHVPLTHTNIWSSHAHTLTLLLVGDMAADHIAGLAFGGQQPHSPSEHVVDPNILVIHSVKVSVHLVLWPTLPAFQSCTQKGGCVQH
jgi:hypothetical protein